MMYLFFYKDGMYSSEYDETQKFAFGIEDISTNRKGPIFAFTDQLDFSKKDPIEMTISMNYGTVDIPFEAESSYTTVLELNTTHHAYNAYPLIKQLIECNNFIEEQSQFVDSKIFIEEIKLKAGNKKFIIREETSDDELNEIFDKLGIKTCMSKVLKPDFSIMMNDRGYWKRVKYNPNVSYGEYLGKMRWTRALICFPEMETAYNCRYKTLLDLEKIQEMAVTVTYTPKPNKYSTDYFDSIDRKYSNEYVGVGLRDILRICLFVPQIIHIEQCLYHMDVVIEINLVFVNRNIKLTVSKEECKDEINTSIYNLIERMLTITMERRDVKENWFYENYKDGELENRFKDW